MEDSFHKKVRIPKGIHISEQGKSGPVVEKCACTNSGNDGIAPFPWCYIFVHHNKINTFTAKFVQDNIRYFIHKTIIYQRKKNACGVRPIERPTVSGLVFMQGLPSELQHYLDTHFPNHHLVNDCSTHLPAVIADSIMQPFMRIMETSPERIRFLLHPFKYYAGGNIRLRLTSGFFAGLEGYVIRIDRDRRLVMDIGGMSVAISGIHCEKFEVVEEETKKYRQAKLSGNGTASTARNLNGLRGRPDIRGTNVTE